MSVLRLVFTSDGVRVGIVSRVLAKSKNGVVSGVGSDGIGVEESESFHFLPIPLMTPSLTI